MSTKHTKPDDLTLEEFETAAVLAWYDGRAKLGDLAAGWGKTERAAFILGFSAGAKYGVGLAHKMVTP